MFFMNFAATPGLDHLSHCVSCHRVRTSGNKNVNKQWPQKLCTWYCLCRLHKGREKERKTSVTFPLFHGSTSQHTTYFCFTLCPQLWALLCCGLFWNEPFLCTKEPVCTLHEMKRSNIAPEHQWNPVYNEYVQLSVLLMMIWILICTWSASLYYSVSVW